MRVEINPKLLSWARERAGYDVGALEHRFPKLAAWENGSVQPTLSQVEHFAKATHTPIGFLFLQEPPVERIPIPDFRTVGSKRLVRASPDLLETIYICQQRQEWYRDFARSLGESGLSFVGSVSVTSNIEMAAARMRRTLGFDLAERREIPTWTDALRRFIEQADNVGILVMCSGVVLNDNHRRLDPDGFRGFALADPIAPLVFINGSDSKAAQIFTLAHELAHIWLGESALSDAKASKVSDNAIERWCNQVATEFLVPIGVFTREYQKHSELRGELDRLARMFKVSTLVILRRMYDAGGITRRDFRESYEKELERLLAMPTGSGGNFYLTQSARVGKRFARALVISTLEGQTLHRDAFRMLGFSKLETFRKLGQSIGVMA